MVITCNQNITTSTILNNNIIPNFDSIFTSNEVEDSNVVKYPMSSSIFNIISRTALPNSNLILKRDLTVKKEITQDGYVLKSDYVDEESFGITLEEAFYDLLTSIRDKYHSLQRREPRLSDHDKKVLENLRSLLTEFL